MDPADRSALVGWTAERHRDLPFDPFGLAGPVWAGLRTVGESHREDVDWSLADRSGSSHAHTVELVHGNPLLEAGPCLRVQTGNAPLPWDETRARAALVRCWGRTVALVRQLEGLSVRPLAVTVSVDGQQVALDGVGGGRFWTAQGRLGTLQLIVNGRDWTSAGISLVAITDLQPYLDGYGWLLQTRIAR